MEHKMESWKILTYHGDVVIFRPMFEMKLKYTSEEESEVVGTFSLLS